MRRLAGTVIAVLLLSGCASTPEPPPTLDSAAATAEYQPLFDDLAGAMAEAYPSEIWSTDLVHDLVMQADYCGLWIGRTSSTDLDVDERDAVIATLSPIIEAAGFSTLTYIEPSEGVPFRPSYGSRSDAAHVSVRFDDPGVSVSVTSLVTDDPCGD